ncbi:MAG: hypothetical protein JEZ11_13325 [Desulfobacterales bacterium]|nr:hypothetical protein [Desulfobacterales bacterium]
MSFLPYEELRVFQLAERLSDEVWELVRPWKYFENAYLKSIGGFQPKHQTPNTKH